MRLEQPEEMPRSLKSDQFPTTVVDNEFRELERGVGVVSARTPERRRQGKVSTCNYWITEIGQRCHEVLSRHPRFKIKRQDSFF